jgi:hypothetical protein
MAQIDSDVDGNIGTNRWRALTDPTKDPFAENSSSLVADLEELAFGLGATASRSIPPKLGWTLHVRNGGHSKPTRACDVFGSQAE